MKYYEINEETARRANDVNSMRDYRHGSATEEYRAAVDKAAAKNKSRTPAANLFGRSTRRLTPSLTKSAVSEPSP